VYASGARVAPSRASGQDLTVFNVTKEAVVVRQAEVDSQPLPVPGKPRVEPSARPPAEPDWWAEALVPLEDVLQGSDAP
jgi:hypothetical protein